ncbi:BQ2448_4380 [Microbotryum intermedium]|uniref:BQ2448_4380 protein n=1 Tax=Microbotryum intermedium TaxID=269621 RepID=A0A238FLE9_9BASI|nr:BQ2448_4380 [Microbotryum intermedium]
MDNFDTESKDGQKEGEMTKSSTGQTCVSSSSLAGIDCKAERRLVRKLEYVVLCFLSLKISGVIEDACLAGRVPVTHSGSIWIMPLLSLVFSLNFIDRSAVGNANVAGLSKDLKLVGYQYNIALTLFYVFFMLVEPFSNLLLKRVGAMWLSTMVVLFGTFTITTAFIRNYHQFLAVRILLGLAEGGSIPAITFVLGRFYRRRELVLRIGIYMAVGPSLSGAFGGLLAGALVKRTIGSVHGWRCIFFVEGLITTLVGLLSFFLIPTSPESASFLNKEERALAVKRIEFEHLGAPKDETTYKSIRHALGNGITWLCCLCYGFINISVQSSALFLPTVIHTLGNFSVVEVQLRCVPPYMVATLWSIFIFWVCFRTRKHGIWIAFTCCFSVTGYIIFLTVHNSKILYFATFLTFSGSVTAGPIFLTWAVVNASPETSRAITAALVPGIGTWGSLVAMWTTLPKYAPRYVPGNGLNVAACAIPAVISLGITAYCNWENHQRDLGKRDDRLEGLTQKEQEALGFKHPGFRYLA